MSSPSKYREPSQEEIAVYAYYLWESEGRQHGRDKEYWFQARAHLIADRQYEAGLLGAQNPPQQALTPPQKQSSAAVHSTGSKVATPVTSGSSTSRSPSGAKKKSSSAVRQKVPMGATSSAGERVYA